MGNTRATLLQEAFNNQWTDEDKKEFLYQAGAPFPELLKIALLNPHVLRDLEIAERERCRRKREALVKKVKKLLSLHTVTLSLASIGLLLTRPICRWTMGYGEPEEIYIFIRWGVALIAIWQAIRLFRAKRAFYVAILLCASAIILNPLRDVDIDEDVYAWLYAIMTFPFALTITSEWRSLTRNVQDAGTATQPHTHERE